jgi:hypothetical protein
MTEREWLECTDPIAMLLFLFGPFERLTDDDFFGRKSLLLAYACFSRLEKLLPPEACQWQQHAALAAEGHYDIRKLHGDGEEADYAILVALGDTSLEAECRIKALLDIWTWNNNPEWRWPKDESEIYWEAERRGQATLIRDIFGNPFRPVTINSAWLT